MTPELEEFIKQSFEKAFNDLEGKKNTADTRRIAHARIFEIYKKAYNKLGIDITDESTAEGIEKGILTVRFSKFVILEDTHEL